jgi:hypothetical protein
MIIQCEICRGYTSSFLRGRSGGCYARVDGNHIWVQGCRINECPPEIEHKLLPVLLGKSEVTPGFRVASIYKVVCKECDWKGFSFNLLRATNPFSPEACMKRPSLSWTDLFACPICREICSYRITAETVCDEPDCFQPIVMGTPTLEGYRQTCSLHNPAKIKGI